jgi:hypothetical protein
MGFPLANCADQLLARLASMTGSQDIARLDGTTLLCERAVLGGFATPGRISAGGGCRLFDALGDTVALNLARPTDRELLPALFEADDLKIDDDPEIASCFARSNAAQIVTRGRELGLAIAAEREMTPSAHLPTSSTDIPAITLLAGPAAPPPLASRPRRVVDLSALWAGPLAAHLLWLAGADVVKIESRTRPDGMRNDDNPFYALLNQGKASVALDLQDPTDKQALIALIRTADIVIEASRPRALAQLGIDAAQLVRTTPGLVWISITAHGSMGDAANWIGFGDDCGVAGGLSAALRTVTGRSGFVGDAIADPLTGMSAAVVAWEAWKSGQSGRYGIAMTSVVAHCLTRAQAQDSKTLQASLTEWHASAGKPFPIVERRPIGHLPALGAHTNVYLRKSWSFRR